jgi:hypothetical protein
MRLVCVTITALCNGINYQIKNRISCAILIIINITKQATTSQGKATTLYRWVTKSEKKISFLKGLKPVQVRLTQPHQEKYEGAPIYNNFIRWVRPWWQWLA